MKKLIYIIPVILAILLMSCKKDKKDTPTPIQQHRTMWFKVSISNDLNFDADTAQILVDTFVYNNKRMTQIDASDVDNNRVIVAFEGRDTGTYIIGEPNKLNFFRFANPSEVLWSSYSNSGILHITTYDTLNKIISGNFNGSLKKNSFPYDTIYFNNGIIEKVNFTAFE